MSYFPNINTAGLGITNTAAGEGQLEGDVRTHLVDFDMPNGKQATVGLKIGVERAADADKQRQEFLETVHPASLTENVQKDLNRFTEQFNEITGYNREGEPIYRVQGRDRELLEMRIGNRRNALAMAQRERALAEGVQANVQRARLAEDSRIDKAANIRAQQMIEESEIERRAKQIASRAGVR